MRCPRCHMDSRVIDSREVERPRIAGLGAQVIRRRRHCASCLGRFTTYEVLEDDLQENAHVRELVHEMRELKKRIKDMWQ